MSGRSASVARAPVCPALRSRRPSPDARAAKRPPAFPSRLPPRSPSLRISSDSAEPWPAVPSNWISGRSSFGRLRSEEHTSELQSRGHLVCRLLLEKKKKNIYTTSNKKKKKKKK